MRILGTTSHFDVEAFFGSVLVATFKTADPANMQKFLAAYLDEIEGSSDERAGAIFEYEWQKESEQVTAVLSSDPFGRKT